MQWHCAGCWRKTLGPMNRQQRRAGMKQNGVAKPSAPLALAASFQAALQHHQAGRLAEARRGYRQILAAHPNHADSLHMLGMVEHQSGHLMRRSS